MTFVQIVGAVIALAGVAWIFKHPSAKGEGEATYAGVTVKALTQGGVLVVIGAALVYGGRDTGDDELTLGEWAASANQICDKGYEKIRALQIPDDPTARFQALPQVTQIAAETNQELQGIGRPIGSEADVDRVLALSHSGERRSSAGGQRLEYGGHAGRAGGSFASAGPGSPGAATRRRTRRGRLRAGTVRLRDRFSEPGSPARFSSLP